MNPEKAGSLGRLLVLLLGKSWFIRRLRPETGIRGDSILYAFWHGVQLPLIYTHRNMNIRIMISRSKDGSLVSAVCEKMGFNPVRGSSSRGGISAARELVASLKKHRPGAITPDGPKGPAKEVKKGVSLVPKRSGAPVIPYGAAAFPAVKLKSWDRFLIPVPFARLVVAEGRPVPPEHCSEKVLTAAINQQQARAELICSPVIGITSAAARFIGYLLYPLAKTVLLFRDSTERRERLGYSASPSCYPVWLHGASLGEIKGLLPVISRLRKEDISFLVTCTTPAGRIYLEKKNIPASYLPLDLPGPVNRFLNRVSPKALILAETEFWPLLLHETVARGIPAAMVNGRLSKKSVRGYRTIAPLFRGILRCFRMVLTRSDKDTERFGTLGVEALTAGDGKTHVKPPTPNQEWLTRIKPGSKGILVAGSTRKGEESLILEIARRTGMTPVIVPRHDGRIDEVKALCAEQGYSPDLWTDEKELSECLIVNIKGVLSALYGLADAAFVGGTLVPVGGHNILEPLAHNVPVIVGPEHFHFTELVKRASEMNVCSVFSDLESGIDAIRQLLGRKGTPCEELFESDFSVMLGEMLNVLEVTHEN